jgi:copper chaperone
MYQYTVPKMSCGGCLSNITKALHKLDPNAKAEADFPTKTLKIESDATEDKVVEAMTNAGYPPVK